MIKFSRREMVLGLLTGAAVLLGGTAFVARPRLTEWGELRSERKRIREEIEADKRLVESREKWESELAALSKQLPQFGSDKEMQVYWLSVMDKLASANGLSILRHKAGDEQKGGEVYELPIECQQWEGTLDALVHFLFDLQSQGAMLDMRQLLVRPKAAGVLRGRFLLFCAYTRGAEEKGSDETESAGN